MTKNTQYFFVIFLPFKINEFHIFERFKIFFQRNNDLEFYRILLERYDYLKFSVCYRKVVFKYVNREVECKHWMELLKNIQSKPANLNKSKEEQNKELKLFCCAYNKSLECQLELIKLHCDREALDFFYINSNRMSQQLINEHCAVFSEDNQKFCKYPSSNDENEVNKKLKFNKSNSLKLCLIKFNLILIVILNLIIVNFKNLIL